MGGIRVVAPAALASHSSTSNFTEATTAITACLLVVAVVSAVIAGLGARTALRAQKSDHERRRADATMNMVYRFLDEQRKHWSIIVEEANKSSLRIDEKPVKVRTFLRDAHSKPARRAHQDLLQELELMAVGCRVDAYSVRLMYDASHSIIRQMWDLSHWYVSDLRLGEVDTRPAQPTAYENFEWLVHEFDRPEGKTPPVPLGAISSPTQK